MLGSATNVQLSRTEARLRLKEDYYAFRDRTTPIFILFPAVLLFLHRHPPAETGYTRELPPSLAEIIFPFTLQCARRERARPRAGAGLRRRRARRAAGRDGLRGAGATGAGCCGSTARWRCGRTCCA